MTESLPADSVGLFSPRSMSFEEPLPLQCESTLGSNMLACETRGERNGGRSKAIPVCPGLRRSVGSYLLPNLPGEIALCRFRHA